LEARQLHFTGLKFRRVGAHFYSTGNVEEPLPAPYGLEWQWFMKKRMRNKPAKDFAAAVGRALRRAGRVARKTARIYGTPIYIWRDGKVVAEKP